MVGWFVVLIFSTFGWLAVVLGGFRGGVGGGFVVVLMVLGG
jgi:hypothetical protein